MTFNLSVYRKCKCGETAHDRTADFAENGLPVFACRNCDRRIVPNTVVTRRIRDANARIRAREAAEQRP